MTKQEIELWAVRYVQAAVNGRKPEDDRVELKSAWPVSDFHRTARQIAGQANAAHGQPILWVIGVDESKGLVTTVPVEISEWWTQVGRWFDGPSPGIQVVQTELGEVPLVALCFETQSAPYLVNAKHESGSAEREVPWREANRTRSARRFELLEMLVERAVLPTYEVLEAKLEMRTHQHDTQWDLTVKCYADCALNSSVVLPWHRATAAVSIPGQFMDVDFLRIASRSGQASEHGLFGPYGTPTVQRTLETIHDGHEQLVLTGPGALRFIGTARERISRAATSMELEPAECTLSVGYANTSATTTMRLYADTSIADAGVCAWMFRVIGAP